MNNNVLHCKKCKGQHHPAECLKEEGGIMKDGINEGDKVNIYFEYTNCLFNVTVLSHPCATGDSWVVKDDLGNISNVGFFARMDKLPIKEPKKDDPSTAWDA